MEVILLWLLCAAGVAAIANSRGRSGFGYFLLSFFLTPVIGLILVLVTNNLTEEAKKEQLRREEHERQLESIKAIAARPVDTAHLPDEAPLPSKSVAEELTQLAALRDKGILTEAEFQSQKASLLRSN